VLRNLLNHLRVCRTDLVGWCWPTWT